MVPTRPLGKTGERISILGFGTAPSGNRLNLKKAIDLYSEALDMGVTYFDTAPSFAGYGRAQNHLGYLLKHRRKEIFLVTKCWEPEGDAALKLLQQNLRELQTDYVDLVFVHSIGSNKMDFKTVFGRRGCYETMMKAKTSGLARFIGFSGHNRPARFVKALRNFQVDVLLNAVNFVDRHTYNFEETVWPLASRLKMGLIAMKVFGGEDKSENIKLSHSIMSVEYHDLAFRYALSIPGIASTAIGMATRVELHQNIKRAKTFKPITPLEANRLKKIGQQLAKNWGPHLGAVT